MFNKSYKLICAEIKTKKGVLNNNFFVIYANVVIIKMKINIKHICKK